MHRLFLFLSQIKQYTQDTSFENLYRLQESFIHLVCTMYLIDFRSVTSTSMSWKCGHELLEEGVMSLSLVARDRETIRSPNNFYVNDEKNSYNSVLHVQYIGVYYNSVLRMNIEMNMWIRYGGVFGGRRGGGVFCSICKKGWNTIWKVLTTYDLYSKQCLIKIVITHVFLILFFSNCKHLNIHSYCMKFDIILNTSSL